MKALPANEERTGQYRTRNNALKAISAKMPYNLKSERYMVKRAECYRIADGHVVTYGCWTVTVK